MRRKTKVWMIVAIVLVLIIGFFYWMGGEEEEDTVKITVGAILPLSGPAAVWGESIKNGMEISREEATIEYPKLEIEIIYEDSQADPARAISAYNSLKLKDIDVVVSAVSRASIPLIPLIKEDKIPLIMTLVSAADVANKSSYAFRLYPDDTSYSKDHFKNIILNGHKTIGILYLNDEFGTSIREDIRKNAHENKIEIIVEERFNPGDTDFKTQLSKIKEKDPDALIYVGSVPVEVINVLKQIEELEMRSEFYEAASSLSLGSIRENTFAEGVYTTAFPFSLDLTGRKFKQNYMKKYNEEPLFTAGFGYDIIKLVYSANKDLDHENFVKNLILLKEFNSTNGIVTIEPDGEMIPPLHSVKIINNKMVMRVDL